MSDIKENTYVVASVVLFAAVFFGGLNLVHDEPPVQIVKADEKLMACLPADTGSRVMMTLVNRDDVLKLRCEHHQIVAYGRAPKEKARYVELTVPVDVN